MIFLAFPGEKRVRWARGLQIAEYLEIVIHEENIYNTQKENRVFLHVSIKQVFEIIAWETNIKQNSLLSFRYI